MGAQSKIEWTDSSWNPIRARNRVTGKIGWFCVHESEGCRNCYAETMNRRLGTGIDYKTQNREGVSIFLDETMLTAPLQWKRPSKIFVGSMTDVFGEFVPDEMIDRMFAVMALCPQHTFQVLTKRALRMRTYLARMYDGQQSIGEVARRVLDPSPEVSLAASNRGNMVRDAVLDGPLPNVWLGVSCEDQANADARIPHLLATPAAVRFLSCEPLLGTLDIRRHLIGHEEHGIDLTRTAGSRVGCAVGWTPPIDWVICGGESGPHARPMHPDWARSLRDQCAIAGVPYFFKQWGEWAPDDGTSKTDSPEFRKLLKAAQAFEGDHFVYRLGKHIAGRQLDGRTHDEFPVAA